MTLLILLDEEGGLCITGATQYARNAVDVALSEAPVAGNPSLAWDALNTGLWSLEAYDPFGSTVRLVQYVETTADPLVVRVWVDGPLDAGVEYRIVADTALRAAGGAPLLPACSSALFTTFLDAPTPTVDPEIREQRTDLANPSVLTDAGDSGAVLGTYQVTSSGDYAAERGRPYLRKRILRRATTALGEFVHLPDYGFAEGIKGLITPDKLRRMQARAKAQILSEPDVASVQVTVSQDANAPNVVYLRLRAVDTTGEAVDMVVPIRVGGDD